jgi:hypothetical protein
MPGQHDVNVLLAGLSDSGREVLAEMLGEAFRGGVREALVILLAAGVPPFQDGYEGSPYHDFAGRLEGWSWWGTRSGSTALPADHQARARCQ